MEGRDGASGALDHAVSDPAFVDARPKAAGDEPRMVTGRFFIVTLATFCYFLSLGSLLPLVAILVPGDSHRIPVAFVAVLVALVITGAVSAYLGQASKRAAVLRLVVGGALAMAVTFAIGELLGVAVT